MVKTLHTFRVTETRQYEVEYDILAESRAAARELAAIGDTLQERDERLVEVSHRAIWDD